MKTPTFPRPRPSLPMLPVLPVLFAVCLLCLLLGVISSPAQAQEPDGATTVGAVAPPPASTIGAPPAAWMVELAEPPAAVVYAAEIDLAAASANEQSAAQATVAAQAQIARISAAQEAIAQSLAALDVTRLFAVQRVYNGVAVLADAEQRAAIAQLPGVAALHPLIPKQPHNHQSIPWLGVPSLWEGAATGVPLHGEKMRVAVIDTGIDYLHRDFAGSGSGYTSDDPTVVGDVADFPGARVVGGYDFVGDEYNGYGNATPKPDPDPIDCYGHGTHVAGTLGGSGVTADGSTFTGPYDTHVDFSNLTIGPGVAPRADMYALKVFGCTGQTIFADLALEWAVDPNHDGSFADRMHVVNLSLGSAYGGTYDTTAIAADNAALAGVIVVASAGNEGGAQLIVGSPSIADRVISVAAGGRNFDYLSSFSSRGPRRGDAALKPDVAAPGESIYSAARGSGRWGVSLSGTSMAAPHVAGMMALLRQAHPDWSVEELKALTINTTRPLLGPPASVRGGAGRIAPTAALASSAIAYAAGGSGLVNMSFGAPAVTGLLTTTQQLAVANKGGAALVVTVTYQSLGSLPGVQVITPAVPLRVPAHVTLQTPITLVVDAAQLRQVRAPSDPQPYGGQFFAEESGYLVLDMSAETGEQSSEQAGEQPADAAAQPTLRVPLYVAPRPVSAMTTTSATLDFDSDLHQTIELTGSSIITGGSSDSDSEPPAAVAALASLLELRMLSPNTRPSELDPSQPDTFDFADLKTVGITARTAQTPTAGMDEVESAAVYFGLTTWAPWSTPNEVQFRVLIDTDIDGEDDYLLYNYDASVFDNSQYGKYYRSELHDLKTDSSLRQGPLNALEPTRYDAGLFFRSALVLPVAAADLGLSAAHSSFAFYVETVTGDALGNSLVVDRTPSFFYDVALPALRFTSTAVAVDGTPVVRDEPQTAIEVQLDPLGQALRPAAGVLILHHHNAPAEPASVVAVNYTSKYEWPAYLYLPFAAQGN